MNYGHAIIERLNSLINEGIDSISVIQRHSARNYDSKRPFMEPFMGLTEEGKGFAKVCAERLNFDGTISFFSSMICRCLETAYMMEKGISGGKVNPNILEESLFPFYVKNPKKVYEVVLGKGEDEFFRMWFGNELSQDIIENAEDSAIRMGKFMVENLREKNVNFMISHDWNLYLVQEYLLKRSYFKDVRIEFLDGFLMYKESGKLFIENQRGIKQELKESDL